MYVATYVHNMIHYNYVTGLWKTDRIVTYEINRIFIFMLMQFQQVAMYFQNICYAGW